MSQVRLHDIRKTYDGKVSVIDGVDLTVADGEFMVFVGPSGCGKSTMMRMIAGLEEITDGELWIGDEFSNDLHPTQRGVSMVFQNYALYPHMTVEQNMGFGLKMAGLPKAEVKAAVGRAADLLRLTPLLARKPGQLSGGQRQRVAIGRAIVRKPRVFLFDEPLSNLDAGLRVQMRVELAKLHAELGTTMIYVTHDQVEAMTLGQRIAVFNHGRIEQVGTPAELYEQPVNPFVATFLGSPTMNMLPGELVAEPLRGGAQTVGVRPEALVVATPEVAAASTIAARVEVVEYLGDSVIVHARVPQAAALVAVKMQPGVDRIPEAGSDLRLAMRPDGLHRFDAQGQRLRMSA